MKRTKIIFLLLAPFFAVAQNTEVYLFDLNLLKNGTITVEKGINVSKHTGYDNQPCFHPEKSQLFYASGRNGGQTDIVVFDYKTGQSQEFTSTPESEYSPTVTPDKGGVSCIIMRDKVQDLGKYSGIGSKSEILVNTLTVGYHTWLDESELFLFILGEPTTLHRYNIKTRKDQVVASNIGRSLLKIPGEDAVSFIDRSQGTHGIIKKVKRDGSIEEITKTIEGHDDIAWLPDGRIIGSDGRNLMVFNPKHERNWQPVRGPALNGITRIAVSNDGKKIAVVVAE